MARPAGVMKGAHLMRLRHLLSAVSAIAAVTVIAAADPPYAGKWKMNPAKSDFGQLTVAYDQLPSGEMQETAAGQSYKFKLDGKDYPDQFGNIAAWKSVSSTTWQRTLKLKEKVLTTDTFTLSPDGRSLTMNSKGTKPNGEAIDDTFVFERVSGGPGLAGKWKAQNMKSSSPTLVELTPSGADGLMFKIVDMGLTCDSKLDGKDYPCSGPTLSAGWTVALATTGLRSLDMTVKNNGKTLYRVVYTVSPDGKTLTETGTAAATDEKIKVVYDRQ
jgi:hypothetical protein